MFQEYAEHERKRNRLGYALAAVQRGREPLQQGHAFTDRAADDGDPCERAEL